MDPLTAQVVAVHSTLVVNLHKLARVHAAKIGAVHGTHPAELIPDKTIAVKA